MNVEMVKNGTKGYIFFLSKIDHKMFNAELKNIIQTKSYRSKKKARAVMSSISPRPIPLVSLFIANKVIGTINEYRSVVLYRIPISIIIMLNMVYTSLFMMSVIEIINKSENKISNIMSFLTIDKSSSANIIKNTCLLMRILYVFLTKAYIS